MLKNNRAEEETESADIFSFYYFSFERSFFHPRGGNVLLKATKAFFCQENEEQCDQFQVFNTFKDPEIDDYQH